MKKKKKVIFLIVIVFFVNGFLGKENLKGKNEWEDGDVGFGVKSYF